MHKLQECSGLRESGNGRDNKFEAVECEKPANGRGLLLSVYMQFVYLREYLVLYELTSSNDP